MKMYIIIGIMILSVIFGNCVYIKGQEENMNSITKFDTMDYPIVTKDFESFDFETYEERPPAKPSGYRDGEYIHKLPNGIVKKFATQGEEGFYCSIYYPDSYFCELKIYYANGNIKEKGLAYVQGFQKGIWYEFDESGKLIRETDYDKPFKFTFEDIVKFCEKNNIKLAKGYNKTTFDNNKEWYESLLLADIRRSIFEGMCKWEIIYAKEEPKSQYGHVRETITLDGETGKAISIEQQDYELN
jgi:YD repeat-containing protein